MTSMTNFDSLKFHNSRAFHTTDSVQRNEGQHQSRQSGHERPGIFRQFFNRMVSQGSSRHAHMTPYMFDDTPTSFQTSQHQMGRTSTTNEAQVSADDPNFWVRKNSKLDSLFSSH